MPKVLTTDEYEPSEYDAVTFREGVAVCVDADEGTVRLVPTENVVSVEGDADAHLTGPDLPGWFHGGGSHGVVDLDRFPDLADHVAERDRGTP